MVLLTAAPHNQTTAVQAALNALEPPQRAQLFEAALWYTRTSALGGEGSSIDGIYQHAGQVRGLTGLGLGQRLRT